jgi:hypothetical protein
VTSTIARKLKANDFTRVELDSRMDLLDHDWRGFIPVELTRRTLEAACGTALRFALRGADSIHLAALLALHNRVAPAGHRVVLVASDRELLEAAQTSGIETLDPAA